MSESTQGASSKSRPILFSGPMVRALLEGRKTQTRRILKGSTEYKGPYNPAYVEAHKASDGWSRICPYGQPGDLLWVRETWALASRATDLSKVYYKAHENASHTEFHEFVPTAKVGHHQPTWPRFKPSIHMPRWASRLTLELTEVRVERLQDISEADAIKEGLEIQLGDGKGPGPGFKWNGPGYHDGFSKGYWGKTYHVNTSEEKCCCREGDRDGLTSAVCAYRFLWESINGPGSWDANPWVWCLSFSVHQQNIDGFLESRAAA